MDYGLLVMDYRLWNYSLSVIYRLGYERGNVFCGLRI